MPNDERIQITRILEEVQCSEAGGQSPDRLLPLVYEELRRLAGSYMRRERGSHTLQPTALVHEAYAKLVDQSRVQWKGRTHFFAVSAQAMRRILIDHARGKGRVKRGGDQQQVTFEEAQAVSGHAVIDLDEVLSLNQALERLAALDERQARVVELRIFGGLSVDDVAATLAVSRRTVEGDWTHAKAWLRRELTKD